MKEKLKKRIRNFTERYPYIAYPLYVVFFGLIAFIIIYLLFYRLFLIEVIGVRFDYKFDFSVYLDERTPGVTYLELVLIGLATTIEISLISIILAMGLGVALAVMRLSRVKILDVVSKVYIEFFRNTPLLLQIFFWYYASHSVMPRFFTEWFYAQKNTELAYGVIALAAYTGAFIAEEIRAGIQSIPKEQMEASRSQGLTFLQAMFLVILPQAFRIVIPPLINQSLNLMKNSSLVMAIGVLEVMASSRFLFDETFRVFEALSVATLIYLTLSLAISFGINQYNKRFLRYIRY